MTINIITGVPLLAALSLAALTLRFLYKWVRQRMYFRKLPGPPHSFLWGHLRIMLEVAASMPPLMHPQAYYTEIGHRYKLEGIFYIDLWPIAPSSVVLNDPDLLDQVTVKTPLRQHRLAEKASAPIIGPNSIVTANGPMWKKLHHAMAPAFSWSHIRNLTGVIVDECELFREALGRHADTGKAFSMEQTAGKLIFDVIARVVFSFSLNAQTTGSAYLDDLKEMITLAEGQLTDPAVVYNPVARFRVWRRRRLILSRLHPSIISKVSERLEKLRLEQKHTPSRKDPGCVLDLMLREHVHDEKGNVKTTPLPASEVGLLLTNIKGALIGGNGTTNDSLCFLLMLLSKAPGVVDRLRKEHNAIFDVDVNKTKSMLVSSPEKLQELSYTDAVLKESLRLFPVGFGLREADPGATITCQGKSYPIDNGLAIALNGQDLHYNPHFFPNPTAFKPDRWLDPNNEIPRSYYRTFSRGPRGCLGMNLALNELKIILVLTLRDFDFRCAGLKPNYKPRTTHTDLDTVYGDIIFQELGMEAKPRGGMMMTVRRRTR